jgi:hypothetical protein
LSQRYIAPDFADNQIVQITGKIVNKVKPELITAVRPDSVDTVKINALYMGDYRITYFTGNEGNYRQI